MKSKREMTLIRLNYIWMRAVWRLLAKLPFAFHYFCSDYILFPLIYYIIRYRRATVDRNLRNSFPDRTSEERNSIRRDFYHLFCDYIVETVKLADMPPERMKRHMSFKGLEAVEEHIRQGRSAVVYIAHCQNWEWITSLPLFMNIEGLKFGQIYHPLRNDAMDELFLNLREQYGAVSIPMKKTLRVIMEMKKNRQPFCIGFIADQVPKWEAIHHWITFLNQETPVFTGTERIARKTDSVVYFMSLKRTKRAYYEAEFHLMTDDCAQMPENSITELYFKQVEAHLKTNPAQWLWTHNRWKRTREEWEKRQKTETGNDAER